MKKYIYLEPTSATDSTTIETILTEDEIIKYYWEYWCKQMKKVNKEHLINRESCIEDFCIVNWAFELQNEY